LGRDLSNVFFVYTGGWIDSNTTRSRPNDAILYIPVWKNGAVIDLAGEDGKSKQLAGASPGGTANVKDVIHASNMTGWSRHLFEGLSGGFGNEVFDKGQSGALRTFPLMSLIDRVGPYRRASDDSDTRPEPIRRGGREFNVSQLVASGRLVVLAQAVDTPTPLPMQVNGGEFESKGTTYYQVSLPLNRDALKPVPPAPAAPPKPAAQ
jgi:hypothetical protein